ncbi:hypothetical protein NPS29_15185 [Pseudomonas putida]|uniref:hypothetical protein n=1 Tax=Pseudomonas putida TaxID=303 RepID=UPI002364A601|nr:hypothetical protein [Pseudomonas putida]MDD1966675.1 hypothetical protein [Pseudomonas putida]
MNILKRAVQACRTVSRSLVASRAVSALKPSLAAALDKTLETAARVLCVQNHGVMVCGSSAASVAHFCNPHFSSSSGTV